jgi:hypothetical protein
MSVQAMTEPTLDQGSSGPEAEAPAFPARDAAVRAIDGEFGPATMEVGKASRPAHSGKGVTRYVSVAGTRPSPSLTSATPRVRPFGPPQC